MKVCCVEDAPVAPPPSPLSQDQRPKSDNHNVDHNLNLKHNVDITMTPPPSKGWPVVVMCHGLGGTRALYSQLCITLASR